jgi:phosphoribosyl-AMP cyclohydrolase
VSLKPTQGFPAAEGSVAAETVVEVASVVEVVVAAVVDVELLSLSPMNSAAVATTMTAAPRIEKTRRRR